VNNWWNHGGHLAKVAPLQQKMSHINMDVFQLSNGIMCNVKQQLLMFIGSLV